MKPCKSPTARRVPAADPPPDIVRVLERIEFLARLPTAAQCALAQITPSASSETRDALLEAHALESHRAAELLRLVRPSLRAWRRAEDPSELRERLGLNHDRKRRKSLTVMRELEIAVAYAEHLARDSKAPRELVAAEYHVDVGTVSRANRAWREQAAHLVSSIRQHTGGRRIRYRGMFARVA